MKSNAPDNQRKETTVYSIIERLSVVVGLLALVPLTRIWDRSWWLRLIFVVFAVALIAATTYDLLPRWSRRWPVTAGVLLTVVIVGTWAPGTRHDKPKPLPETAGRATIASPRNGEFHALTVREDGGTTDGFAARGTCVVPKGYRAMIVSRADQGPGYWLLSDEILGDCLDDGVAHSWTAERVDPSWSGMGANNPVTIGVTIVRKDLAERARSQTFTHEPLDLPPPAASTVIRLSRIK